MLAPRECFNACFPAIILGKKNKKQKNKQLAFFTKRFNRIRRSVGEIEVNTGEKRGGRSRWTAPVSEWAAWKPSLTRWSDVSSSGNSVRYTTLDNEGVLNNWCGLKHNVPNILKLKIVPVKAKMASPYSVKTTWLLKGRSQPLRCLCVLPMLRCASFCLFSQLQWLWFETTVSKFPWHLQLVLFVSYWLCHFTQN